MKLKSKQIINDRNLPETRILHKNKWRTFFQIVRLPELAENDLTVRLLKQRYKKGCYSFAQLTQKRQIRVHREKIKLLRIPLQPESIITLGHHEELQPGEVWINNVGEHFFNNLVSWKSKRIGKIDRDNKNPLFIMADEAREKGWVVC